MNIAFDSTAMLNPYSLKRGIGNFALNQLTTMLNMDKLNNYYFLNFYSDSFSFADYGVKNENLKEFYFYCGNETEKPGFLLSNYEYLGIIGNIVKKFIKKNKIDVFYITSPFDPHVFPYEKEWFEGVKVITIAYDIIPFIMREHYLKDTRALIKYYKQVSVLRYSDKIFSISQSTKSDLINYLSIDESKIDVIYGGSDSRYCPMQIQDNEKHSLFKKYHVSPPYIICIGGDDIRKNIDNLIIAYSKMPLELIKQYQLVIICKLSENSIRKYNNLIESYGVENRVILTGYVEDEDMPAFYNLASLLAFPSQYEGFGLPIVEAFACGIPILTSNNSSLGEIAKDAAILVDPFNIEDITCGLITALTSTNLEVMIQKGFERLKMFRWDNVAKESIDIIENLKIDNKKSKSKFQRIAFFTPLPPMQSGISDYSVDIINALSKYLDIDVYIDDGYEPSCKLNGNTRIYSHRKYIENHNQYTDTIYQVGNSHFHIYMNSYIRKYSGTIVLHDYNLHGLIRFVSFTLFENMELYREYLKEDFDTEEVDKFLRLFKEGKTDIYTSTIETNGWITNYSKKFIVHSNYTCKKLLERNIPRQIATIRHYAKIEPASDTSAVRKKYGYNQEDIIFASFGFTQRSKRSIQILKAFRNLSKEYGNIKYVFVGELTNEIKELTQSFIVDEGLSDKITITGYLELSDFLEYIDMCDICLNLRYPYTGETSGALMRILAKGKCVIINDIGSFSEIPNDCCFKLPSVADMKQEEEIDAIYSAMKQLLENENLRTALSQNALKYAKENLDINIIAKQYYEFLMNDNAPALTEELLGHIMATEIIPNRYTPEEIQKFSKTLAYTTKY